jgi:hypothetical protein
LLALGLLGVEARPVISGVTAHEWGTFTSVAGNEGRAVEWSPLTDSTDLPGFVEHFRGGRFKLGLRGTVRMETPVLYFYSSREETVSVKVRFAKGVLTEWYPHATRVEPAADLFDGTLYQEHPDGSIVWEGVTLAPSLTADFPNEKQTNRYYAARQTTATPLRVKTSNGEQYEKFLFYRGVSTFAVPLIAKLTSGGKVQIENNGTEEIPGVVLFERRGERVGYRVAGALRTELTLDSPELTGSINALGRELEGILIAQGLYQNEARAMIETWRDSWFEEGSRVLYVVPAAFVDRILPLTIQPQPAQVVRAFVGRMEVTTPATERAVERAFATHDNATLAKYGRFLEPILHTMIQREKNPAKAKELSQNLSAVNTELIRNQRRN